MKPLSAAAERAARHRKFHWCRRENGFSDKPIWGVIAEQLQVELSHVLAFVNRLEELANAATPRGSVADFSAAEFGHAIGIGADEAAAIFAALEHPDVGWIAFDHVATFYDRNPDREDATANDRKRRERLRRWIMRTLARLAAIGAVSETERRTTELTIRQRDVPEAVLLGVKGTLARLELESPALGSRRDAFGHDVTQRDIVTVTPEQSKRDSKTSVPPDTPQDTGDNPQAAARLEAELREKFQPAEAVRNEDNDQDD